MINPFAMKKYAKNNNIRGAKTDKLDSITIANYGIEKWFKIQKYEGDEETYAELKILGRRYRFYMELHIKALQELTHILDYTMPGIKKMFNRVGQNAKIFRRNHSVCLYHLILPNY